MPRTTVTHRDFDRAWETRPRPSAKILGEHVLLPPQVPASLVLKLQQIADSGADPEQAADFDMLADLLACVFGRQRVDGWVEQGMDLEQMGDLFRWMMSAWDGDQGQDPQQAPPPPPNQ